MTNELPVKTLKIRLSSRQIDDRELSHYLAADLASREINVSGLIKTLLLNYYRQRQATGNIVPIAMSVPTQPISALAVNPEDALVKRMAGLRFADQLSTTH